MGQGRQQVVLWLYLLQEQNSLMRLFYPHFSPCSTKVTKISHSVPNKMTSLAPYLITKYFPLPLHSSLAGTFLAAVSLKFSRALGGGAGKQLLSLFPSSE